MQLRVRSSILLAALIASVLVYGNFARAQSTGEAPYPEIARPARTWEFLPVVGEKAALFGNEAGDFEAWVYPMKLLRGLDLEFRLPDRSLPASALARELDVRPESATITYANESFSVREVIFVPRHEQGAVIALEVDSHVPVTIEAHFRPDFQLMWPAALGATYASWDDKLHAFRFGEEQHKWFGLVGSPGAAHATSAFDTNYASSEFDSFDLPPASGKPDRRLIVIAGSTTSAAEAEATYQKLSSDFVQLRDAATAEYREYLEHTTSLELPDRDLRDAYDWARISVAQGLVTNPFLGTGLIAGYRTSGTSARPGFAWFFGRDSEWTSLALNSDGDFDDVRQALDFISKFQRQDGKVPHEISQAAKQVPWFTDYPYPWASADATPLFIMAVRDYFEHSGDVDFVKSHWDNLWRAYQFLQSTRDAQGLPKNLGVGHGWIEGGPLVPVESEFYQAGAGAEALESLATLARVVGKADVATDLDRQFQQARAQLNDLFWNPESKFFAYAIGTNGQRADTASVLTTVPMWFGITDDARSQATIDLLAAPDHATDWGMRILSDRDPRFDPSGYHFGSVWPLFTGWAAVGEYRYHRPLAAYDNLRDNALLALDGSAGHVTEVLSGSYFEPLSTSSPHQIWSAAMVISPILRGLFGIVPDAAARTLRVSPHVPADWSWWKMHNVRFGAASVDLAYAYSDSEMTLAITPHNADGATLEFSPAINRRARVLSADVNGRPVKFQVQKTSTDQHVIVRLPLSSTAATVRIRIANDFGIVHNHVLPALGATSSDLKFISETWTDDNNTVTYEVAGMSGAEYAVALRGAEQIVGVDGADLVQAAGGASLRVRIPDGAGYQRRPIRIHFGARR